MRALFEGVPRHLVIDNFPAAVAVADALHPRFTRGFLEYALQRGFISDPARVRRPRDKPRVERSVPYVRERFFKGAQFRELAEMRSAARRWCLEVAGQRITGRPANARSRSSRTRSARCSPPGTANRTKCPTGARRRSTPTITSPVSARGRLWPHWARRRHPRTLRGQAARSSWLERCPQAVVSS